ncbi:hypothetical protein G3O08_08470 [Cryomorpha ignava]|uniref:Uncharacterized protein n=1 Tax=Cryomorpha ignava TaxID=101383 RepID=A0A7K3WPE7_9FLAO|nr:hypothetical protein [Cryomorpha ignava]NEN23533.1 hypothetical protein [Cryomorpha ignava]
MLIYILFSCTNSGKEDKFLGENYIQEQVHSVNLTVRPSTQVVDDKLFFLSDLSDIFELTKGEDPNLFFSLDEADIVDELIDFHFENDTTYPFMSREYAEPLNYYVENFYVSENSLHLVVVVVLPYHVIYQEQDAQFMRQF